MFSRAFRVLHFSRAFRVLQLSSALRALHVFLPLLHRGTKRGKHYTSLDQFEQGKYILTGDRLDVIT